MSAPEIAGAVGANVNTVYSRLRAARADFDRAAARVRARARDRSGSSSPLALQRGVAVAGRAIAPSAAR